MVALISFLSFSTDKSWKSGRVITTYDRMGLKFISQLQKLRFKNSLPSFLYAFKGAPFFWRFFVSRGASL
jgi:hypothetical protein